MGRPRKRHAATAEFRNRVTIAADARLVGTWWRCRRHGLTQDPIILAGIPYCRDDDCAERVLLAHSAMAESLSPRGWNECDR